MRIPSTPFQAVATGLVALGVVVWMGGCVRSSTPVRVECAGVLCQPDYGCWAEQCVSLDDPRWETADRDLDLDTEEREPELAEEYGALERPEEGAWSEWPEGLFDELPADRDGEFAAQCPGFPEMALIPDGPDGPFCIDRWEAVLSMAPDCSPPYRAQQAGDISDVFEFPYCVGAQPDEPQGGQCRYTERVPMYACALPGVTPSCCLSFFQARQACVNAGKRICTHAEWMRACAGPGLARPFPYEGPWVEGRCYDGGRPRDIGRASPKPGDTGWHTECRTPDDVFDIAGNLSELVLVSAVVPYSETEAGTSRNSPQPLEGEPDYPACTYDLKFSIWSNVGLSGFRCCVGLPQP